MPVLKLRFEGGAPKEYRLLNDGATLTIGRRNTNDVVIDNLGVSSHHAKIDSVDGRFLLTDLKSKNGTFINEEMVTSHWLRDGDVITIGKHTIEFLYRDDEIKPDAEGGSLDKTMVLDTDKYQEILAKNYPKGTPQEIERESIGVLSVLAPGGADIRLTNKLVKIGKDPSNDIAVRGFWVGKTAATISNRPSGYYLSYVSGLSKPKVNGEVVKRSVKLEDFDVIEVGSAKMRFTYQFIYKKDPA